MEFRASWESQYGGLPVDRCPYTGMIAPLKRPSGASSQSGTPSIVEQKYSWWVHFLSDCQLLPDAPMDRELPPEGFCSLWSSWRTHLMHSIVRVAPQALFSLIENAMTLGDLWEAVSRAGRVISLAPEEVVMPPSFSVAPEASFSPVEVVKKKSGASISKKMKAVRLENHPNEKLVRPARQSSDVEVDIEGLDDDHFPALEISQSGHLHLPVETGVASMGSILEDLPSDVVGPSQRGVIDPFESSEGGEDMETTMEEIHRLLDSEPSSEACIFAAAEAHWEAAPTFGGGLQSAMMISTTIEPSNVVSPEARTIPGVAELGEEERPVEIMPADIIRGPAAGHLLEPATTVVEERVAGEGASVSQRDTDTSVVRPETP
ncbi:hypothetical protein Taro_004960 [Colocasia esculenta]|uniref:Aminotransferase-like plant mobile domain-containing protein n=1 Tax=Colocasia esculenta TaxID=4460 RepID=A0A843TT61_COLES|nr:hypothetical protein [Colocasia esculenta]